MRAKAAVVVVLLALASSLALGASSDLWLHVYVQEQEETVRVNIPISLVESVLPLIDNEHIREGRVKILDEIEVEGLDLRQIWQEVREIQDGEFVRVQEKDETVRVAKAGGFFLVTVDGDDEKVNVRIPLDVVDALFSGPGDELDVLAAIRTLGNYRGQDMVTVEEGDSLVRVWIDDRQEIEP